MCVNNVNLLMHVAHINVINLVRALKQTSPAIVAFPSWFLPPSQLCWAKQMSFSLFMCLSVLKQKKIPIRNWCFSFVWTGLEMVKFRWYLSYFVDIWAILYFLVRKLPVTWQLLVNLDAFFMLRHLCSRR